MSIMNLVKFGLCSLSLFVNLTVAQENNYTGKVIYVEDGDTISLLVDSRIQMKVRLASIDAPESSHTNKEYGRIGQPYSAMATKFLADAVKGKIVNATCYGIDNPRYNREICELFLNGVSINQLLVSQGWAWANVSNRGRYLRDKALPAMEASARANHLGLWAGANPVPPWEWRSLCWKDNVCPN